MTLRRMGVPVRHRFASDIASHLQGFIHESLAPDEVFITAFSAAKQKMRADLYVAGPPCVCFSVLGGRAGEPDRDSSTFEMSFAHIVAARPTAFLLENVWGFLTIDDGAYFKKVLRRLRASGVTSFGIALRTHLTSALLSQGDVFTSLGHCVMRWDVFLFFLMVTVQHHSCRAHRRPTHGPYCSGILFA